MAMHIMGIHEEIRYDFTKKEQSNTIRISNSLRPSDAYKRQKFIGSVNGVSHQAIISTNADILLIWPLGMTSC